VTLSRRQFVQGTGVAGLGLLSGCGRRPGQAPAALPVVGYLTSLSQAEAQLDTEAFRQGLRALGYVEGQDLVVQYRFADGRNDRLPMLANELVGLPVSSLLALGPPAAHAAKAATETTPIVVTSTDPVGEGLVASLARPGGNITGLSYGSALLAGKKLELLKEVAPAAGRVVALWYAPNGGSALQVAELQDAAPRLGLQLQPVGVPGPETSRPHSRPRQYVPAAGVMESSAGCKIVAGKPEPQGSTKHRAPRALISWMVRGRRRTCRCEPARAHAVAPPSSPSRGTATAAWPR
jgi:putative ABC transport system substrate-binding protein